MDPDPLADLLADGQYAILKLCQEIAPLSPSGNNYNSDDLNANQNVSS